MVEGFNPVRYSIIKGKCPREIVMLVGNGCKWRKCRFCDYHLDSSPDKEFNYKINKAELEKVTGMFGELEVINSGSFVDLDGNTIKMIKDICVNKKIKKIHFECHWIHKDEVKEFKKEFMDLGVEPVIRLGLETFDYNDISKEIDKIKEENNEAKTDEVNEDVKVAKVKGWNVYTIQVASVEDKDEISKIEEVLSKEKVPFSTINIEGVNKVQTYVSFDKESIRNHLEGIRVLYPDAFLAEVKMPVLSLEYTSKYSYLETISEQLGSLIDNFELESKLWTDNKNNINLEEYNTILTNRKTMVKNIEKEVSKIDYKGAEVFKSNLTTYLNNVDKNIEEASKSANEQNYNISEGIFLNSLQGYLTFINSIQ